MTLDLPTNGAASGGTGAASSGTGIGGEDTTCSEDGKNCQVSKCCTNPESQCWKLTEFFSNCTTIYRDLPVGTMTLDLPANGAASSGTGSVGGTDSNGTGDASSGSAPTEGVCVEDDQNCMVSKCCLQAGSTCFQTNDIFASCSSTCSKGSTVETWFCHPLSCDKSKCHGCQGEQCTSCYMAKERDCCLDEACSGKAGEEHDTCSGKAGEE